MISVPLRGVIADGGYRNIIVLVISYVPLRGVTKILRPTGEGLFGLSYVPLRGVTAKMNKSDRPEIGRMYLFHNAGTIITHSAQKEKRNGEKNAAFSGANSAGSARKKT